MDIQIRPENSGDIAAIEAVTIAAFLRVAHSSHTEQFIARALRVANELTLSLVAREHHEIIGHLALSPVTITDNHGRKVDAWYGLGPLAVAPARQRQGIGTRLIERALLELKAMRAAGCVLLGDPAYYSRFGWRAEPSLRLVGVPPEYFMALSLHGSVPVGVVQYSEAFDAVA